MSNLFISWRPWTVQCSMAWEIDVETTVLDHGNVSYSGSSALIATHNDVFEVQKVCIPSRTLPGKSGTSPQPALPNMRSLFPPSPQFTDRCIRLRVQLPSQSASIPNYTQMADCFSQAATSKSLLFQSSRRGNRYIEN